MVAAQTVMSLISACTTEGVLALNAVGEQDNMHGTGDLHPVQDIIDNIVCNAASLYYTHQTLLIKKSIDFT